MIKLLWTDLEMTGLDIKKEVIIEVAMMVTDAKLDVLDKYHTVVKQPQSFVDSMDDWNRKHHGESGLTALIANGKDPLQVEKELIEFIDKHFPKKERIILAGNSIAQDRLFIDKYFIEFAKRLHYRMLDVSSFKIVFNNFYQISYSKPPTKHRATDDILESMNELKKYLSYVNVPE